MAHKTLVNGTVYEIDGGKTLIGGTVFSIDKGKTLVDGTLYEVGFAQPMVTLTIHNYTNSYSSISINGVPYTEPFSGFPAIVEVPVGTVIDCHVSSTVKEKYGTVTVNGVTVLSVERNEGTYQHTVTTNAQILVSSSSKNGNGTIAITET